MDELREVFGCGFVYQSQTWEMGFPVLDTPCQEQSRPHTHASVVYGKYFIDGTQTNAKFRTERLARDHMGTKAALIHIRRSLSVETKQKENNIAQLFLSNAVA